MPNRDDMFGFMRFYRCAGTPADNDQYRWYYCGVCKTLGKGYGHKTRFLLNRDIVFFSELLSELVAETPHPLEFACPTLSVRNCWRLPRQVAEIPLTLRIAAAYNVLLAAYQLDDHIADTKSPVTYLWQSARWVLAPALAQAAGQMAAWGFPLAEIAWWMREQRVREMNCRLDAAPEQILAYLAEPTAAATGLGMRHGALIVGRPDCADAMSALGHTFGELIYLLDALDDFEKDAAHGEFNALRVAYRLKGTSLPVQCRQDVLTLTQAAAAKFRQTFAALPLAADKISRFQTRVTWNLNRKSGREACLRRAQCDVTGKLLKKMTFREKWRYAIGVSRKVADLHRDGLAKYRAYLAVTLLVIAILAMPQKALGQFVMMFDKAGTEPAWLGFTFIGLWLSGLVGMVVNSEKNPDRKHHWCDNATDCCCIMDCMNHCGNCDSCDCSGCDCCD